MDSSKIVKMACEWLEFGKCKYKRELEALVLSMHLDLGSVTS